MALLMWEQIHFVKLVKLSLKTGEPFIQLNRLSPYLVLRFT